MKKVWNDAMLEELDITATAGGRYPSPDFDSDYYYDPSTGSQVRKMGQDYPLSENVEEIR